MQIWVRPVFLPHSLRFYSFPLPCLPQLAEGSRGSHGDFPAVCGGIGIDADEFRHIIITEAVADRDIPAAIHLASGKFHHINRALPISLLRIKIYGFQIISKHRFCGLFQGFLRILPILGKGALFRHRRPHIHKKHRIGIGKPDSPGYTVRPRACGPLPGNIEAVGFRLHNIKAGLCRAGNWFLHKHYRQKRSTLRSASGPWQAGRLCGPFPLFR